jgi:hypothetical protein
MLDDILCEAEYPYAPSVAEYAVEWVSRLRAACKPRVRRRGLRAFRIRRSPTLES